jgi:hypothetical protein
MGCGTGACTVRRYIWRKGLQGPKRGFINPTVAPVSNVGTAMLCKPTRRARDDAGTKTIQATGSRDLRLTAALTR